MDLGAIVEVVIGIIFVWIVLSLATIQIQEWISARLDKRAKDMEAAIHEMLANPNLKAQLYDHPVIRGLTAKKRKRPSQIPPWFYRYPILRGFTREKRKLPSYIPAQQFTLALFDIAMTANTESSLIQQGIFKLRDDLQKDRKLTVQQAVIEELNLLAEFARSAAATEAGTAITNRTKETLKTLTKQFVENFKKKYPTLQLDDQLVRILTLGMEEALAQAEQLKKDMDSVVSQQPPIDKAQPALSKIRRGIAALSVISPEVNQTLSALLMNVEEYANESEKHLAKARQSVETWFNDAMDRASGVFKRYSQKMAFFIGVIIALLINVDSISLTMYLWREPSVRQVLVAQASQYELTNDGSQNNPQQTIEDLKNQLGALNIPVGWSMVSTQGAAYLEDSCKLFPTAANQSFGIPVFAGKVCVIPIEANNRSNLATKLLGIFITGFAAMQGAPFWFDMLKRLVNLRATGPNPAEKGR